MGERRASQHDEFDRYPFAVGEMVRLKAQPSSSGVIMEITHGAKARSFKIFHDNQVHEYFESQLEAVEARSGTSVAAHAMQAGIASMLLLHPTSNHLYSTNSGRIDYEPYQFRPVLKLISSDRPRLLIADDVGVGKTIEAGLIIKELQARQPLNSVLVICPKQLVVENKWRNELKRFDEDFIELNGDTLRFCINEYKIEGEWPSRYRKAIVPYSLLDERLLLGSGQGSNNRHGLTSCDPPVKFDLIIVDEAHHVRNRETWKNRVVRHLLENAEAGVLISATPIQTGSGDLFNLLKLIRPDLLSTFQEFERMREPNSFLAAAEQFARNGRAGWQEEVFCELDKALQTTWGRHVLSARAELGQLRSLLKKEISSDEDRVHTVRLLQSLNTFSGLINRTRRRDIGAFTVRKPETIEVDFNIEQKAVYEDLMNLCSRILETRNPSMSLEFLLSTLKRQASSSINGLAPFIGDLLENRLSDEIVSETEPDVESISTSELIQFRAEIELLASNARAVSSDPKLDALLLIVSEKQELDNNKLLVFSTFRHTLAYLESNLAASGIRVGLVHGDVSDEERRDLRARFALSRTDPRALDVLLSSEVGTEGLDNQFCDAIVNYDIPWNPMRIEQRIGRIDRRGQKSEAISIKNFVVRGTVDANIYHRCLDRIGVFQQSLGGSEEILGELTRQIRRIADDFSLTEAQRDQRLQQLADNKIARIHEQTALEEKESALFGLRIQRLDDEGIGEVTSPWLRRLCLESLVCSYLSDIGYARADGLFKNSTAVIRPNDAIRDRLLTDFRSLSPRGSSATRWVKWLTNMSEASRRLTFDPHAAVTEDVELLAPTHPLIRAAAVHFGTFVAPAQAALRVEDSMVPPGRYPFAIYGWTTLGVRTSFSIKVITLNSEWGSRLEELLTRAGDADLSCAVGVPEELVSRHYDVWVQERQGHIEVTRRHLESQLASLRVSFTARRSVLADQIRSATHDNIRRMRESELQSLQHDFEYRSKVLTDKANQCDLTTRLLYSGVLEVVGNGNR